MPLVKLTFPPDPTEYVMTAEGSRGPALPPPEGTGEVEVLLSIGFRNDHGDFIDRTTFNAWVYPSKSITRCAQDGSVAQPGTVSGSAMQGPDAPYWQGVTNLPPDASLGHFLVTLPGPGEYEAVMRFNAPALYGKADKWRKCRFTVEAPAS